MTKDVVIVGLSVLSFAHFTYSAIQTVEAVPNNNNHGDCSAGEDLSPETADFFSYTDTNNKIVSGVCVKAGSDNQGDGHTLITSDTTINSCYVISGIGTTTVTVSRIGSGPDCKGISHVDVMTSQVNTSATPTASPTTSPTTSPTSQTTVVPSSSPTVTPTTSPSSTPTATPTPTVTPTATPETDDEKDSNSDDDSSTSNTSNSDDSDDRVLGAGSDTYKNSGYADTGITTELMLNLLGMTGSLLVGFSRFKRK